MFELKFDEPTLRSLWLVMALIALVALAWLLISSHDAVTRRQRRLKGAAPDAGAPLQAVLLEAARRISWLWSRDLPMPWSARQTQARRAAAGGASRRTRDSRHAGAAGRPTGPATRVPSTLTPASLSPDEARVEETRSRVQQEFELMRQAQRAQFDKARQARAAALSATQVHDALSRAFADTAPMPERARPVPARPVSGMVKLDLDDAQAQTLVHAFAPTAPMDDAPARRRTEAEPDPQALARAGFQPLP